MKHIFFELHLLRHSMADSVGKRKHIMPARYLQDGDETHPKKPRRTVSDTILAPTLPSQDSQPGATLSQYPSSASISSTILLPPKSPSTSFHHSEPELEQSESVEGSDEDVEEEEGGKKEGLLNLKGDNDHRYDPQKKLGMSISYFAKS